MRTNSRSPQRSSWRTSKRGSVRSPGANSSGNGLPSPALAEVDDGEGTAAAWVAGSMAYPDIDATSTGEAPTAPP